MMMMTRGNSTVYLPGTGVVSRGYAWLVLYTFTYHIRTKEITSILHVRTAILICYFSQDPCSITIKSPATLYYTN